MLDNKAHEELPEPLAPLMQANRVPPVALGNQVSLASQVTEEQLVLLDKWVPEVHLVRLGHLDLLDFLPLENLDLLDTLGQWDPEESLA